MLYVFPRVLHLDNTITCIYLEMQVISSSLIVFVYFKPGGLSYHNQKDVLPFYIGMLGCFVLLCYNKKMKANSGDTD